MTTVLTDGTPSRPLPLWRRPGARYVLIALPAMAILYGLLYYRHPPDSLIARILDAHMEGIARASGAVIGLFADVTVNGRFISGRFPLEIVLDCGAVDVQAIFAAAVLAFPVSWRRRAFGVVLGLVGLYLLNLARIVCLYFVGVNAPGLFHVMHEEVLQLVIIVSACLAFVVWAFWARGREGDPEGQKEPAIEPA
jgi:exosortase family protein XrtM